MQKHKITVLLVLLFACALYLSGCAKVNDETELKRMDITAQAPTSAAVIEDAGVSLTANQAEHDEGTLHTRETVYVWCKVKDVDIGTNMHVTINQEDNAVKSENMAVNRDMVLYVECEIEEAGEYTAIWQLTNKDAYNIAFSVK